MLVLQRGQGAAQVATRIAQHASGGDTVAENLAAILKRPVRGVVCAAALVMAALALDKKHAGGGLRWVLPTGDGFEVRSDVPVELVERVATGLLAGAGAGAAAERAS